VIAYVIRRSLVGLAMLIAMSMVTFVLFFNSGVDPARQACGKNCSPALQEQVRKALGYDKPVWTQWGEFAKGVFVGRNYPDDPEIAAKAPDLVAHCPAPCLGYSQQQVEPVLDLIKQAAPVSVSLAILAFIIWMTGGVLFGVIAALRKGRFADRAIVGISLLFYAFPTFFIGLLFYKFVAIKWKWVPVPEYTSIADGGIWAWFQGLWLPSLTLALFFMAAYVRMTRAFVLESSTEDYIRTAKAKGLAPRKVVFKHTLRAALTPLVTMAGIDFAVLLGGAIITETVFNYPGLGQLAVRAATGQDLPTTVGIVLVLATLVIVANIIVDLLYAVIDPRVRLK
jgi:peptide/nickel transport system permease protein